MATLEKTAGHYEATCYYCPKKWGRGSPISLEMLLANDCPGFPQHISRWYLEKAVENDSNDLNNEEQTQQPIKKERQIKQLKQHYLTIMKRMILFQ